MCIKPCSDFFFFFLIVQNVVRCKCTWMVEICMPADIHIPESRHCRGRCGGNYICKRCCFKRSRCDLSWVITVSSFITSLNWGSFYQNYTVFLFFFFCKEVWLFCVWYFNHPAVCLDGSPPAYHLDRGFGLGINNWLVHLEVRPFFLPFSHVCTSKTVETFFWCLWTCWFFLCYFFLREEVGAITSQLVLYGKPAV